MNMDKLMAQSLHYFLLRDVLLLLLFLMHVIFTYQLFVHQQYIFLITTGLLSLVWLGYYIRSVWMYLKAKKDPYLIKAMKDEYIKELMFKSSYHGFTSMFIASSLFIVLSLFSTHISVHFEIPYYIASEIILLIGIITGDISKAIQVRE